ncbi:MAG: hypothetical protein WC831_01320 [Parcubacteria group bacterium]
MANYIPSQKGGPLASEKPKNSLFWASLALMIVLALGIAIYVKNHRLLGEPTLSFLSSASKSKSGKTFSDKFTRKGYVGETAKMSESSNGRWWVNSGGRMDISGGTGKTILGNLSSGGKWFKNYKKNNPEDTDGGLHPQNIFRLVTRGKWENFSQEAYFRIRKMNLSDSENRNESNGILLFNRYQDGDDLYYTGLRVDGYAVIKKKIDGDYHTLAYERIFRGDYDRDSNPNLLPVGRWIGIRSVVKTKKNGDVEISLYWKNKKSSKKWILAAHYTDKGQKGDEITDSGYGGIRTDFMDVEFDQYKISEL